MTTYVELKRAQRADGLAAVTIEEGDHGLCRFVTWKLYDPAPDIPELGGPTWTIVALSGLYENASEAEASAVIQVDWLDSLDPE